MSANSVVRRCDFCSLRALRWLDLRGWGDGSGPDVGLAAARGTRLRFEKRDFNAKRGFKPRCTATRMTLWLP